jgi:hypothetical protein
MTQESIDVLAAAIITMAGGSVRRKPYEYQPLPPEKPKVIRNRAERRKKPVRRIR